MAEWRKCAGFPKYAISDEGNIRRYGRTLKPYPDKDGYLQIKPSVNGVAKTRKVHRLALETFVGPPPEGKNAVNHIDGDKTNNSQDNIEWVTPAANTHHAYATGLMVRGSGRRNAKLTELDIPIIRQLRKDGLTYEAISCQFGVNRAAIHRIICSRAWQHA
jgi:hypothetical protein